MENDITFDIDTLKYYQEYYTSHDSEYQGLHYDLISLWGRRLLLYQDAFKNMPGFPDNVVDEALILTTAGLWEDLEDDYDIKSFREYVTEYLDTYNKYPVQIDPEMFTIFLNIKEDLGSDEKTKLFIFLLELEESVGLLDICKCHGNLNLDDTYKTLSFTLNINEKLLREILAPINDLDRYGFIKFNQEKELSLQERCALLDLVVLYMRTEILQKPNHAA